LISTLPFFFLFAMHFSKAIVWGISIATVTAAALPADDTETSGLTCEFRAGDAACAAHVRTRPSQTTTALVRTNNSTSALKRAKSFSLVHRESRSL
jgi:hypothetical protein